MAHPNDYLYLTTIGRVSGEPRQVEIWYVTFEDAYYLVSEARGEAQWVKNIEAQPSVIVRLGGRDGTGVVAHGRTVDPDEEPERAAAVSALMNAKYGWSDGLIVELRPTE